MVKAFTFGKFYPFHKGHQAMIEFALTTCDFLSVLICSSDKELIPGAVRKKWIEETFSHVPASRLEILFFDYEEAILPNTSETSHSVSEIWAGIFKELYPDVSLLITSEPYGALVADFMNIVSMDYDVAKEKHAVSSSAIRNKPLDYWSFLPDSVKHDFIVKVVILGTESTGKTTLTKKLATHYGCSVVLEAAREIILDSKKFGFEELKLVADKHAEQIALASFGSSPLLIIDTDIHMTQSYAKFVFDKEIKVDLNTYKVNQADLYLYLDKETIYVQDGTRFNEPQRNALDFSHREILVEYKINYVEVCGNWEERFFQSMVYIDELLKDNWMKKLYLK